MPQDHKSPVFTGHSSFRALGVSGDLKSVRLALTGRERGPELKAVIAALPRDELLRRTVR